jgi:two-component system OmpR family sensor kinase
MKFPLTTFRARLTLWHVLVMGTILLAAGVLLYLGMARGLLQNLDSSLWAIAETEAGSLLNPENAYLPPVPRGPFDEPVPGRVERYVQLIDPEGNILSPPPNVARESLPVSPVALEAAAHGKVQLLTARLPEGRVRILYLPIEGSRGVTQILQVGLSMQTFEDALAQLFRLIAIIEVSALLLIGVGGFFLTKKSLHPVDEIAQAAQVISERNLSQRLPEEGGTDELAHLVRVLNRMLGRIEEAFKAQVRFTSDASHELRTPLAVMKGSMEIALKKERDAREYREVLTSVREEVERMSRLVLGLLTLARADARVPTEKRRVKLQPLLGDVVDQMRVGAAAKQVMLELEAPASLAVMGSEDSLRQLFLNLVDNAVRYTEPGGRAWVNASEARGEVVVEVGDTGIGIEEEDRSRIFDRFYRSAKARGSESGGSGLGLAICAQIVKDAGGRIETDSSTEPPAGTRMRVFLPSAEA